MAPSTQSEGLHTQFGLSGFCWTPLKLREYWCSRRQDLDESAKPPLQIQNNTFLKKRFCPTQDKSHYLLLALALFGDETMWSDKDSDTEEEMHKEVNFQSLIYKEDKSPCSRKLVAITIFGSHTALKLSNTKICSQRNRKTFFSLEKDKGFCSYSQIFTSFLAYFIS